MATGAGSVTALLLGVLLGGTAAQVCERPQPPLNGQIRWGVNVNGQQEVQYSCYLGFTLFGPAVQTCGSQGWSPPGTPVCEPGTPIRDVPRGGICPNPVAPLNGRFTARGSVNNLEITYECFPGFLLVGNSRQRCDNGIITPPEPPICRPLPTTTPPDPGCPIPIARDQYTVVRFQRNANGRVSSVTYSCVPGYALVGRSRLICSGGRWPQPTPYCVRSGDVPVGGRIYQITIRSVDNSADVVQTIVTLFRYNAASGIWEQEQRIDGLQANDFPYSIDGLTSGLYCIRVDQELRSGGIITIIYSAQNAGFDGVQPLIPTIIPGQSYQSQSFSGLYTITLQLPQLTPTERSQYQTWTFQWRRLGGSRWNSRVVSTSTSSIVLSSLQPGSYEVRFQATGSGGRSPYSVPYYFYVQDRRGEPVTKALPTGVFLSRPGFPEFPTAVPPRPRFPEFPTAVPPRPRFPEFLTPVPPRPRFPEFLRISCSWTETRRGYYIVVCFLPRLTESQLRDYGTWEISWRLAGSRNWQVSTTSTRSQQFTIPYELRSGAYQVRARASGERGATGYTRTGSFVLGTSQATPQTKTTAPPSGLQFPFEPVSSAESRRGFHVVTLNLPRLTESQLRSYQLWQISWRSAGSRNWQVSTTSTRSRQFTIPYDLRNGTYQVRARASGVGGSTGYTRTVAFVLPRSPGATQRPTPLPVITTSQVPTTLPIPPSFQPVWPSGEVISAFPSRTGFYRVTIRLPEISSQQQQAYRIWLIEYRPRGGPSWQIHSVLTSRRSVTLPRELRNGNYEVRVRAASAGRDSGTTTIQSFRLPLEEPTTQPIPSQVRVTPSEVAIAPGGQTVLRCTYTGSNPNSVTYFWTKGVNGQLPRGFFLFDSNRILLISQAQVSHSGDYHCHVRHASGESHAESCLGVGGPPVCGTTLTPTRPTQRPIQPQQLPVKVSPSAVFRRVGENVGFLCRAEAIPADYTTTYRWYRQDRRPLPGRQITRNTFLSLTNLQESYSGTYVCAAEATNIFNGVKLTGEASSVLQVGGAENVEVRVAPKAIKKEEFESITFECTVSGTERRSYWKRKGTGQRVGQGRFLQLRSLSQDDSDDYCCVVDISRIQMEQDCGTLAVGDNCVKEGMAFPRGDYSYVNTSQVIRDARSSPAADIIFLVDESASMIAEHAWLADISNGLDKTLKESGIGSGLLPNQFGLVGFGKDHPDHITGRCIPMPVHNETMGTADEFNEALKSLALNGRLEDMYLAMNLTLDKYPLRTGLACQLIGVTDEGRTPLSPPSGGPPLTYDFILSKMRAKGCILNVVVNEQMVSKDTNPPTPALGVSSNNDSAVEMTGGKFRIMRGVGEAVKMTGHGTTHDAYVKMAMALGGAAWDLNLLRKGGDTAQAFTNAFIDLKVKEISEQVCERCYCETPPTPTCRRGCLGESPVIDITGPNEVEAGKNITLECVPIAGDPIPELEFKIQPGSSFPVGYRVERTLDSIRLHVPSVTEKFCVDCFGTNLDGEDSAEHCVSPLMEPPVVKVDRVGPGPNGPVLPDTPVRRGGTVHLRCIPTAGAPVPTLTWGTNRPALSEVSTVGDNISMTVRNAQADFCVDCIGRSVAGEHSDQKCITVIEEPDVEIIGTNNDQPVLKGGPVELRCVPNSGIPPPQLNWGSSRPAGAITRTDGSSLVMVVNNVQRDFCVDCTGRNIAGTDFDNECITVFEEPDVEITGTNNGQPVLKGGPVELRCVPNAGIPTPQLSWGSSRPAGAITRTDGNSLVMVVNNVQQNFCVDCTGRNTAGTDSDTECITVHERPDVEITGTNRGQPVVFGSSVTLECIPRAGVPAPRLQWENLPSNAFPSQRGSNLLLTIPRLTRRFCVDCIGESIAGSDRDTECVEVQQEVPIVEIEGSNKGRPVNEGGSVDLVCIPRAGIPSPTLSWSNSNGGPLPAGAFESRRGESIVLTIPRLDRSVCIDCTGRNVLGTHIEKECVDVLKRCPHPLGRAPVFHGGTVRNYTVRVGRTTVDIPASAVVAFVVDESGSMITEHKWLRDTVATLERNLVGKGIGRTVRNQYALVGFGHKDRADSAREMGMVLQPCGTAEKVQAALSKLFVDGRLEDGYSAIGIALDNLTCLQEIQQRRAEGEKVACQIILATDEGRDILDRRWNFNTIEDALHRNGCILNIVINEKMQGRATESAQWERALGVASNGQAVIATERDSFSIVGYGEAIRLTGHENTHDAYVELAMSTGGAAWDLNMLRDDTYHQSFTNGFIEVKVQEIRRQIIGQCHDCNCFNGSWRCREIGVVNSQSACLFPSRNLQLSAAAAPRLQEAGPGELVSFVCESITAEAGPVSVMWSDMTERTFVEGNRLTLTNVTEGYDNKKYECRAQNANGYSDASTVEISMRSAIPLQPTRAPDRRQAGVSSSTREVRIGEPLVLTCCGGGQGSRQVTWTKADGSSSLPNEVQQRNEMLIFPRWQASFAGRYICFYFDEPSSGGGMVEIIQRGNTATIQAPQSCQN